MGEVAEDIVAGRVCELCGRFFKDPDANAILEHGYPVVCWECWAELSKAEKKHHQRATAPTL